MDSKYRLGLDILDDQHSELIRMVEELHENVGLRTVNRADIDTLHRELLAYIDRHFALEEGMMVRCSYPGLAEHRASHEWFMQRISSIFSQSLADVDVLYQALEALVALNSWILRHIMQDDASFVRYLSLRSPNS